MHKLFEKQKKVVYLPIFVNSGSDIPLFYVSLKKKRTRTRKSWTILIKLKGLQKLHEHEKWASGSKAMVHPWKWNLQFKANQFFKFQQPASCSQKLHPHEFEFSLVVGLQNRANQNSRKIPNPIFYNVNVLCITTTKYCQSFVSFPFSSQFQD